MICQVLSSPWNACFHRKEIKLCRSKETEAAGEHLPVNFSAIISVIQHAVRIRRGNISDAGWAKVDFCRAQRRNFGFQTWKPAPCPYVDIFAWKTNLTSWKPDPSSLKLAEHTPYSAKYLNLLIRQGKLAAHKEGRLWLSTKEAIENYIKNRKRKV